MSDVALKKVVKRYGFHEVIHGIDLDIKAGEFVAFVGPSGCGKSTLLRMIAGLEDISDGEVEIGGDVVNDISPSSRGIAMVFQSYALYPHMSVFNNMAFGLRLAGVPRPEIETRVRRTSEILELGPLLERLPKQLSGGQRQRVAIGRAIVRDPEVFLFDEPLSNLDAALRVQTRIEIARLHKRLKSTMIYVTHDQVEAMTLADKIVVLNAGRIEQVGTPLELYHEPVNTFVAGFIGSPKMNFLPAQLAESSDRGAIFFQRTGYLKIVNANEKHHVTVGIRPEHLQLIDPQKAKIVGSLELIEQLGEYALAYIVLAEGRTVTAKIDPDALPQPGQTIGVTFDGARAHLFNTEGERIGVKAHELLQAAQALG
jgi:multiple sugar transport system ATP-binding protein/alpha-glucoside transport system ATP-binding protein